MKIFLITGRVSSRGGHGEPLEEYTTLACHQSSEWYKPMPFLPAFTSQEKADLYMSDNKMDSYFYKVISLDVL